MLRMAVSGLPETVVQDAARRLRDVQPVALRAGALEDPALGRADVVVLTGGTADELSCAERCLRAGRPVYWAGRHGADPATCDRLQQAAASGGGRVGVVNPERYLPSRRLVKQQLAAGSLGEVGLVRLHRWEPLAGQSAPPAADWRDPVACVWSDLDLVLWLVEKPLQTVYAAAAPEGAAASPGAAGGSWFLQVHLGFAGGAMALIDYSNRLPPGDHYGSLSVIGATGAAYADDHQNMQLLYRGGPPASFRTEEGVQQWVQLLQDLAVIRGPAGDDPASLSRAHRVNRVASAVREALRTGRAVAGEGA